MSDRQRIYLDNAATSWPKPESVYQAVDDYNRRLGAPAGRGAYGEAVEVQRRIEDCRRAAARLIGADDPQRLVFGFNGTDALNMALHGLLRAGDRVVTSVVEHNSVLRPLRQLEEQGTVEVVRVGCDADGVIDLRELGEALRRPTRLVAVLHASNVTGAIQPVEEIAQRSRSAGARLLVDAAQTLGHLPMDLAALGADLVAGSGHKGLLGPLGVGLLYASAEVAGELRPWRSGGTGTRSEEDRQPDSWPDRMESGNHNVPALLGLAAGLEFLQQQGVAQLHCREQALAAQLRDELRRVPGVRLVGGGSESVGVVSVVVDGFEPQEVAALLDQAFSIQVRAGFHCAPLAHRALGTAAGGGTVRFSVGPFNEPAHISAAAQALAEMRG